MGSNFGLTLSAKHSGGHVLDACQSTKMRKFLRKIADFQGSSFWKAKWGTTKKERTLITICQLYYI